MSDRTKIADRRPFRAIVETRKVEGSQWLMKWALECGHEVTPKGRFTGRARCNDCPKAPLPDLDVTKLRLRSYKLREAGDLPCLICGASVVGDGDVRYVHVCKGGLTIVGHGLSACTNPGGCLAAQPIGAGCWRRVRDELAAYESAFREDAHAV